MNRKQDLVRLEGDARALAKPSAAAPSVEANGDQLAREAIRSFNDEIERYRRLKDKEPERLDPNSSPEWQRQMLVECPPEQLTFSDIERLSRVDAELAKSRWEEVKAAARRDVETGWHAARALEPEGGSAWERACFLANRDRLHRAWSPRNAIERMLLDEMAQYEAIRAGWLRILSTMSREPETQTTLRRPVHDRKQPRTFDAAHATSEAMRMVERLQRLYHNALRTLVNMRRGKSAFIVQRSGQINVAMGPQANGCNSVG